MLSVSAVDFIAALPVVDPHKMMRERSSMQRGFFALQCISEKLEDVVSQKFKNLAAALVGTAAELYELVSESIRLDNRDTLVNPHELRRAFQRFENVLACIAEVYPEITNYDVRAQPLLNNLQEYYHIAHYVFVKNPNLIVD